MDNRLRLVAGSREERYRGAYQETYLDHSDSVGDLDIRTKPTVKYLGVVIDSQLSFGKQI